MYRDQRRGGPRRTLALYVVASAATAALAGAVLGAAGSLVSLEGRAALGSVLAIAGVIWGVVGLLGGPTRPLLQCDRETPQRWVHEGRAQWALKNGAALGFGAGTRLGFVLWYAIPAGAFLMGTPAAGAALYGAYGVARAGGAGAIWLAARRSGDFDPLLDRIGLGQDRARAATTAYLVASCTAILVLVGL